ncbi:MAG: DUF2027 domain-containing protein [Duncaniella sp.]|nr:DUF2027 domain-containing protein [Duncaniella sp.]
MAKIGDRVRFLHSVGGGIIRRIEGSVAYVDDDGFEIPTLIKECVVVAPAAETVERISVAAEKATVVGPGAQAPATHDATPDEPAFEETPGGDRLNVVLAWEPLDSRHLSTTEFDTYLVNDSNYYLYFVYATRPNEDARWTTRHAGVVEPGIQVFVDRISPADLPTMDRVSVQLIAFKKDRPFEAKNPVAIDLPLDTTKFFRLHCFRPNVYFDNDVIAIDLIKDDRPHVRAVIDSSRLEEGIRAKRAVDRPTRRPVEKRSLPSQAEAARRAGVLEIDLHIDSLVDTTAGLSNADMLNLQVDKFREVMDANLRNRGLKIVFIHGKGEGVLRQAIMKELRHRYKGHQVQDASFREYGFGATQVTI